MTYVVGMMRVVVTTPVPGTAGRRDGDAAKSGYNERAFASELFLPLAPNRLHDFSIDIDDRGRVCAPE